MERMEHKYIHIRHPDYWWKAYCCPPDMLDTVELCLSDDLSGVRPYFFFELHNLPALHDVITEHSFIPWDHPDYHNFLLKAKALQRGELDYFIGMLCYPIPAPDLSFCNQPLGWNGSVFDLKPAPGSPYRAVIFLREERPLMPALLKLWIERLSALLFGRAFLCHIANPLSKEAARAAYLEGHPGEEDLWA